MSNIEDRIAQLEATVSRQRTTMNILTVLAIGACVVAYVASSRDELRVRRLEIVDGNGMERFVAYASADGTAATEWYDADGSLRLDAFTNGDGDAALQVSDAFGGLRMDLFSLASGQSSMQFFDQDQYRRVDLGTLENGQASLQFFEARCLHASNRSGESAALRHGPDAGHGPFHAA
jgi:hypothetical protein